MSEYGCLCPEPCEQCKANAKEASDLVDSWILADIIEDADVPESEDAMDRLCSNQEMGACFGTTGYCEPGEHLCGSCMAEDELPL